MADEEDQEISEIVSAAQEAKAGREAADKAARRKGIGIGLGVGIGSAALAAALLYANHSRKRDGG